MHTRDPIWASVLIPAAPLPFQLPACGPGRQSRTAQGFGTLHPRGRPGRGSWLQIGIVSAWGANHQTEELPLCLSSLYIRLSNEKIIKTTILYINIWHRARRSGAVVKVLALHARDPIWALVLSRQPTSLPAPCLWPRKAVEDGPKLWDPAPAWETRKRLLASDRHSIGPLRSLGE